MRVIRLSDGRICFLRPARPKIDLPPGQTLAFAILKGERRSAVRVPVSWEGMHEADLRQHVEDGLRDRGRHTPAGATPAVATPAVPAGADAARAVKRGPWWGAPNP